MTGTISNSETINIKISQQKARLEHFQSRFLFPILWLRQSPVAGNKIVGHHSNQPFSGGINDPAPYNSYGITAKSLTHSLYNFVKQKGSKPKISLLPSLCYSSHFFQSLGNPILFCSTAL